VDPSTLLQETRACVVRRTKREREDSAREEAPERRVAEGVKAEMRGPAEAGPVALISDCACPPCYLPIYLLARVLEEIRDHRVACIGTPIRTRWINPLCKKDDSRRISCMTVRK